MTEDVGWNLIPSLNLGQHIMDLTFIPLCSLMVDVFILHCSPCGINPITPLDMVVHHFIRSIGNWARSSAHFNEDLSEDPNGGVRFS